MPSGVLSCHGRSVMLDGKLCKSIRETQGYSREHLSAQVRGEDCISPATIKRAETGKSIRFASARGLAKALGTSLDKLLPQVPLDPTAVGSIRPHQSTPPSIAVLPFYTPTTDPGDLALCDGLADDLVHRLTGRWFPVIVGGHAFKDISSDHSDAEDSVDASYIVRGRVHKSGQKIRIFIQLLDTSQPSQNWSQRFDFSLSDVFTIQDELATQIVQFVDRELISVEYRKIRERHAQDLDAWQLALRGAWHYHRHRREDNETARRWLTEALTRDREMPMAWHLLARTYQREIVHTWCTDLQASMQGLLRTCDEFEKEHPDHPQAHFASAWPAIYVGERDTALWRLSESLAQDPNCAPGRSLYGQLLAMASEPDRGLEQIELAMRLSPRDPERWTFDLAGALAHFVAERYEETIAWAKRAAQKNPRAGLAYGTMAAAMGLLGQSDAGKQAVQKMIANASHGSMHSLRLIASATDTHIRTRFVSSLERLGLHPI